MIRPVVVASIAAILAWPSHAGAAEAPNRASPAAVPAVTASQDVLERPARIHLENAPLTVGLSRLRAEAGLFLGFSPSLLPTDLLVSCACEDVTVRVALDRILEGTGFRYARVGNQILIESEAETETETDGTAWSNGDTRRAGAPIAWSWVAGRQPSRTLPAHMPRQTGTIAGQVVDAANLRPLSAVQVFVQGEGLGALTDQAGRYEIENVPAGEVTLVAQLIGYSETRATVRVVAGETVTYDLRLPQRALDLDAIVVTGTAGQARRREVGNTIGEIRMSDVEEPVSSMDGLLQSRVPAMTVVQASGTMGAGSQIRLRGNVSVSQSNQPLIYVDGVRQSGDAYPRNVSAGQAGHLGSNTNASPLNDINPSDIERIEVVKGAAAATLYGTEAAGGVIQIFTKRGAEGAPRWTVQTDQRLSWIRPFGSSQRPFHDMDPWLKTAHGQMYDLSVSGGTSQVQYFLSGSFEDGDGVLPADEERRYRLRANLSLQPLETLSLDFTSLVSHHAFSTSGVGNNTEGIFFNVVRAPNNSVGSGEKEDIDRLLELVQDQANDRLSVGLTARWAPFQNMANRFTFGLDRADSHMEQFRPFGFVLLPEGDVADIRWQSQMLTFDYVGSYDFRLTSGIRSNFSWGAQLLRNLESRLDAYGRGLPGPGQHTIAGAGTRLVTSEAMRVNTGGVFVQNLFDFNDRYFLTVGLRVDGNSAFGEDFGLQSYPKVSASYVISDEDFWPDRWGQVKLRGAYGHAGRAPGAFDAVRTWDPISFGGEVGFVTRNLGNPNLGPERTEELEFGLDAAFFEGRVALDFSIYRQTTKDALFPIAQPPTQGFLGSQLENVGKLQNRGMEMAVNTTVLQRADLFWDVGFSVSTNRSEILDQGTSSAYTLVVGQPAPVTRGHKVLNAKEFEDPVIERDAFFGPNQPTHTIGLNTRVQLPRGIVASARGEYQGGFYIAQGAAHFLAQRGPGPALCDHAYAHVPHAEYDGPGDTHPNLDKVNALDRARCYRQSVSLLWRSPADFFRLREVTVQTPVPFAVPGATRATFTASLRNVWGWENRDFAAWNPESASGRDPLLSLTRGATDNLPPPASATFSVQVQF